MKGASVNEFLFLLLFAEICAYYIIFSSSYLKRCLLACTSLYVLLVRLVKAIGLQNVFLKLTGLKVKKVGIERLD